MGKDIGIFRIDEENGQVILEDEFGNEDRFLIEREFNHDGYHYIILVSDDEERDGPEEAGVLKLDYDEDGGQVLEIVNDEVELAKLQKVVDELFSE